jgi:hypothetical protein
MYRLAVPLAAGFLLSAVTTEASQQGVVALGNWKRMDNCAKQAQAAYPDYSAEANAKRDQKLKECLNSNNLPPRQPSAPPPSR